MKASQTFSISGWPAVIVAIIVLGFAGFRYYAARTSLDTQGETALQLWIQSDYARRNLARLERNELSQEAYAQMMASGGEPVFDIVGARGSADEMIVKVTLKPVAAHPPDMPRTLFYEMHYDNLLGWRFDREARAWEYHLKLF